MTVVVSGSNLSLDEVVRVARGREEVTLAPEVRKRMQDARAIVERSLRRGDTVYGLSTGLGVLKRVGVDHEAVDSFNRRLLDFHRIGQGSTLPVEETRAALLRLLNHFALGTVGVRPDLADRIVKALDEEVEPEVHVLGNGLIQQAELALGALGDFPLAPGEGLAMIDNDCVHTGLAAPALWDASALAEAMDSAAALSLEAFVANATQLHSFAVGLRGHAGVIKSADRMRHLLRGSFLWKPGIARNLQDPLTFRCVPGVQGALHDAVEYTRQVLTIELNSGQGNPVVVSSEDRLVSVGNFELQALTAAVDFVRIALAASLTSSQERSIKLLDTAWSGLPTGLVREGGTSDSGLAMYQILVQTLTSEARVLAQPVSFEGSSTTGAEGIEDRWNWGALSARKLAEMVVLGELIVAIELVVATQAVELRGLTPLGEGTDRIVHMVRKRVPFAGVGEKTPSNLGEIAARIRSRELAETTLSTE